MLDTLDQLRTELRFALLAFVIMPDHMHLLVVPSESADISRVMQAIKGRFARHWNAANGTSSAVWQGRYFESVARTEAQLARWIEYIHYNAVQAGLATTPEEYPYSSAAANMQTDLEVHLGGTPGQAKARPSGDKRVAGASGGQAESGPSDDKEKAPV